jgi:hypothetical protein
MKRTKSYIEKLLPEPKPNSEPMMMGIASASILQNPLLLYDIFLRGLLSNKNEGKINR